MTGLRHRGFRQFVIGQVLSQLGENMSKVSLAWLAMTLASPSHLVLVLSGLAICQALPPFLFGGLYGAMIDGHRFSTKSILFWADVCRGLIFFGIPLLAFVHLLSLPLFFLLTFSAAIFSGIFGPAMTATLPDFPETAGTLIERNTTINITGHVGMLLGPVLGGILTRMVTPGTSIIATGTTFLLSALMIYRVWGTGFKLPSLRTVTHEMAALSILLKHPLAAGTSMMRQYINLMVSGLLYTVRHNAQTRLFCLMAFMVGLTLGPINILLPVYVKHVLDGGPVVLGLLMTAAGLGMMLFNAVIARVGLGFGQFLHRDVLFSHTEKLLMVALFVSGELLVPTGIIHQVWLAAIMAFMSAGLADLFNPVMQTELQMIADSKNIGKILTSMGSFFLAGLLLSSLLTTWTEHNIGLTGAFVLVGIVRIAASMMPLLWRTVLSYSPSTHS